MSSNQAYSEQFRLAAERWADKEAAASLLEESKSSVLARRMTELGDVPVSHAERDVKASKEWGYYIEQMCKARAEANHAKIQVEFIRMRYWEQQGSEASKRAEMRL